MAVATSKTSSSSILVPKTTIPLVSTMGWALRCSLWVVFFLQSRMRVMVCLCTLMATRCHLGGGGRGRDTTGVRKQVGTDDAAPSNPVISKIILNEITRGSRVLSFGIILEITGWFANYIVAFARYFLKSCGFSLMCFFECCELLNTLINSSFVENAKHACK